MLETIENLGFDSTGLENCCHINIRHLCISSKWDFWEYFLSKIQKRYLDCSILVTWPPLRTLLDLTMLTFRRLMSTIVVVPHR